MSIAASPPPMHSMTLQHEKMIDELDEEIARVREQIDVQIKNRKLLRSALLSSTQVQEKLLQYSQDTDLDTLINKTQQHTQANVYRMAFGVTAFPFVDPSPESSGTQLLGIRFDVCRHNGLFDHPYYVICKRANPETDELRVHRHTIPALVPLQQYEEKYLPVQDGDHGSEDSAMAGDETKKQNLHDFVHHVRGDLVAWRLRQQSIELLREELEISSASVTEEDDKADASDAADNDGDTPDSREGKYGVQQLEAVGVDARYARILWTNDRVGRIKISNSGMIERAIIFGNVNGHEGRYTDDERRLEQQPLQSLATLLQQLYQSQASDKSS